MSVEVLIELIQVQSSHVLSDMGPVTPQTDVTPFLTPTTPTRTQMRWSPNASSSCSTAIRIPATHRGAHSPHSLEGDQQTKDPLRPLNRANSLASHTAPISGASGTSWDSSNYVYYNDSHKLQDYNFDSCSFPSSIFSPPVSPKEISVEQKSSVRPNAPPQVSILPLCCPVSHTYSCLTDNDSSIQSIRGIEANAFCASI